jgi:hypothetical protein
MKNRWAVLHANSESVCYGRTEEEAEDEAIRFWYDGDASTFRLDQKFGVTQTKEIIDA